MEEKDLIREELAELLDTYYSGSFAEMACGYIRCTGMTQEEVGMLLEAVQKAMSS